MVARVTKASVGSNCDHYDCAWRIASCGGQKCGGQKCGGQKCGGQPLGASAANLNIAFGNRERIKKRMVYAVRFHKTVATDGQ